MALKPKDSQLCEPIALLCMLLFDVKLGSDSRLTYTISQFRKLANCLEHTETCQRPKVILCSPVEYLFSYVYVCPWLCTRVPNSAFGAGLVVRARTLLIHAGQAPFTDCIPNPQLFFFSFLQETHLYYFRINPSSCLTYSSCILKFIFFRL